MLQKLEIYAIAISAGLLLLVLGTAGGYLKGRLDEKSALVERQLADNAKAMQDAATAAQTRAAADDQARQKALEFAAQIDVRIADVNTRFSKLPSVVVDSRGCERLTPNAGMRWNATELLPTGPAANPAGGAPGPVSASAVPTS